MNKKQRLELSRIKDRLEEIRSAEEEKKMNLEDVNLDTTPTYDQLENCIEILESAIDELQRIVDGDY